MSTFLVQSGVKCTPAQMQYSSGEICVRGGILAEVPDARACKAPAFFQDGWAHPYTASSHCIHARSSANSSAVPLPQMRPHQFCWARAHASPGPAASVLCGCCRVLRSNRSQASHQVRRGPESIMKQQPKLHKESDVPHAHVAVFVDASSLQQCEEDLHKIGFRLLWGFMRFTFRHVPTIWWKSIVAVFLAQSLGLTRMGHRHVALKYFAAEARKRVLFDDNIPQGCVLEQMVLPMCWSRHCASCRLRFTW